MSNQTKTALVTGANSGIGFEAAAQLAEQGYRRVILATRSQEKADVAKQQLTQRTGKDVFEGLVINVSEPQSAHSAVDTLVQRDHHIDVLILNAGMTTGTQPVRNSDGVELTFASTLIGHHVMTMRLLAEGRLTTNARIIIAGSEGARGSVPGMDIPDFDSFAQTHFAGDIEAALTSIARVEAPYEYKAMDVYVTAKVYVAWWAAALSRKLPKGMTVNAVSPGSVPATNFARNLGFPMRFVMTKLMPIFGSLIGMVSSVGDGARRYIDAISFDDQTTGKFYASMPGKMIGQMTEQKDAHFFNEEHQEASWNVIARLAGIDYPVAESA